MRFLLLGRILLTMVMQVLLLLLLLCQIPS
jgi:hypothetical protein